MKEKVIGSEGKKDTRCTYVKEKCWKIKEGTEQVRLEVRGNEGESITDLEGKVMETEARDITDVKEELIGDEGRDRTVVIGGEGKRGEGEGREWEECDWR